MTIPSSYSSCANLAWNQTCTVIAGTGKGGSGASEFNKPECIVMDANDAFYVCDHHNDRIHMWPACETSGVTEEGTTAGCGATAVPHPQYLTFDKDGYMYVTGHVLNSILCFPPNSTIGTTVVGTGTSGTGLNQLDTPTDMVVDDNLNLYIIDLKNKCVMKWAPNATNGNVLISNLKSDGVVSILFAPKSTNEVYLSDGKSNAVYRWKFNASAPNVTLTQVNTAPTTLKNPSGMVFDPHNNLYVVDKDNKRVVLYCENSTIGIPAIIGGGSSKPALTNALDVALDSDLNLYVVLDANMVIKYARL